MNEEKSIPYRIDKWEDFAKFKSKFVLKKLKGEERKIYLYNSRLWKDNAPKEVLYPKSIDKRKRADYKDNLDPVVRRVIKERSLIDNDISKTEQEAILVKASQDFTIFAMLVGKILHPRYQLYKLHLDIAWILNEVSNKHLYGAGFSTPPQAGKSLILDLFIAWEGGKYPELNQTIITYAEDLSVKHILRIRDVIKSSIYKKIFPKAVIRKDADSKTEFIFTKGGIVRGIGRGAGISGNTINRLYIDDLVKEIGEIYSPKIRETLDNTVSNIEQRLISGTDMTEEEKTKIFVIGTRYFADDPVGHFMDEILLRNGIVKNYPVQPFEDIYSSRDENKILWKVGDLLLPERIDAGVVSSRRRNYTPDNFNAVYQGIPLEDSSNFKKEWIKYREEQDVLDMNPTTFLFIDLAVTINEKSDETGFAIGFLTKSGVVYVKAWGEKLPPKEIVDKIFSLNDKYNFKLIGMEKMMGSDVIDSFMKDEMKRQNRLLRFELIPHGNVKKETRILGTLPLLYSNQQFQHIAGDNFKLEKQMFEYPKGKHDDILDAVAGLATITGGEKQSQQSLGKVTKTVFKQNITW